MNVQMLHFGRIGWIYMRMYDIIARKRDGIELTKDEIEFFTQGCTDGSIPDYQTAALLMAIYINGMSDAEILNLTFAMRDSGKMADLSGIHGPTVDKHSTGGVGDKTSLIVVPIAAAIGCKVVKMSGRGLGHTGGTIDKLESIPGFKMNLKQKQLTRIVNRVGGVMIGHSGVMAPADKKIYDLRDVTATVESLPLIASSIMSKKLACGSDCILLDVKFGSGALMKDVGDAMSLASEMVKIGKAAGKKTAAVLTNMDVPLGYAVGNSLEVIEAIRVLKGEERGDLLDISIELTAHMASLTSGLPIAECRRLSIEAIENGTAFAKFKEIVAAQGGDAAYLDNTSLFEQARYFSEIRADRMGYFTRVNTEAIGRSSMLLGAGRALKEDKIDYSAGIMFAKKPGDFVEPGDLIATLFSNDSKSFHEAVPLFRESIILSDAYHEREPLIYDIIK